MKSKILIYSILLILHTCCFGQRLFVRAKANNLNLRTGPDLTSQILKTVKNGEAIGEVLEKTGNKTSVIWNGIDVVDYWYKVKYLDIEKQVYEDVWVFGKGIELSGISYVSYHGGYLDYDHVNESQDFDNEWIDIKYTEPESFDKLNLIPIKWKPTKMGNSEAALEKGFKLKFANGRSKMYEYNNEVHDIYVAELPDIGYYIYCHDMECCGEFYGVDKKNGKEFIINIPFCAKRGDAGNQGNCLPIFAPDKETYFHKSDCEPGGMYSFGFAKLNGDNAAPIIDFDRLYISDFRFIDNRSGIAKLENGKYLKIRLK